MGKRKKGEGRVVVVGYVDEQLAKWGKAMQEAMDSLGITQSALAETLEVSEATVSRWVNGKAEPKRANKRAIAEALHTTVGRLFPES